MHSFFSSTYVNVTFLLMYGAMWKFDIRFDTRFFAVAYCLLGHTELVFMGWFTEAIRSLAKYMTAVKRIQVSDRHLFNDFLERRRIFATDISFT
jgi:hypothetical protein